MTAVVRLRLSCILKQGPSLTNTKAGREGLEESIKDENADPSLHFKPGLNHRLLVPTAVTVGRAPRKSLRICPTE